MTQEAPKLTDESRRSLFNLISDAIDEVGIHDFLDQAAKRGVLNHVNLRDWLAKTIKAIYDHEDYSDRILSHGLNFKTFDGLVRKVICHYFDRLDGGGALRRAAMLGFSK